MMLYQRFGSSEEINMDMEHEQRTKIHKDRCSRHTGILVILGACVMVFMTMTFVIFLHQQSKFLMLESWMNSHSSNLTSVKPDLQNAERQDASHTEVKSLMGRLSSAVSALTSKLNEAVNNQDQKQTETKNLLNSLSSSVTSLQADQHNKQRDIESLSSSLRDLKSSVSDLTSSVASLSSQLSVTMQNVSRDDLKSLMNSLSSAVSVLTARLSDAVKKQEQKQGEAQRSLESLQSLQTDQQNKQDILSSSLRDLMSSVSDLTSSVTSISSQLSAATPQQDVKRLMNSLNFTVSALTSTLNDAVKRQDQKQIKTETSLDSLKSDQQNKQRDLESLKSSMSDLKSSVSDLTSSVASLSSKQQTSEERVLNAVKELITNMNGKTAGDSLVICKSGWVSYKSSCFLFCTKNLNWTEARDYCKGQGASLLKIQEDDEEWAFLNQRTIPTAYWVGLTDQTTGQWRWADDTPYVMNKKHWNPGQPDDWKNHGLGEEGEDCVQMASSGKLNDGHCSTKMRFICRVQY